MYCTRILTSVKKKFRDVLLGYALRALILIKKAYIHLYADGKLHFCKSGYTKRILSKQKFQAYISPKLHLI